MKLYGVYEGPARTSTRGYAAVLRQEVVGVPAAATVGEEETPLATLVKVKPGNVSWTDALVLNL